MDQSRKSSSGNMDECIRQYAEELMRAYRRQNPSPVPVREPTESAAPLIPAEPVRGEIPPPPAKRETLPERELPPEETLCRPLFPIDSPIFQKPIQPASPPKPSPPPADRQEQGPELSALPNPGVILRPVLPVPPIRQPLPSIPEPSAGDSENAALESKEQQERPEPEEEWDERKAQRELNEETDEEPFLPPRVVEPPEDSEFLTPAPTDTASPGDEYSINDTGDTENWNHAADSTPDDMTENGRQTRGKELQSEPVQETPSPANESNSEESSHLSDEMPPSDGVARLRVWVTTARQAIPIEGARVVVTQEDGDEQALRWVLTTDQDGNAEIVKLPAVQAKYSQQPGVSHPYTCYTIEVSKPGYFTVRNNHVPMYGGVTTIQPVDLIPLPENMGGSGTEVPEEIIYNDSEPQEL